MSPATCPATLLRFKFVALEVKQPEVKRITTAPATCRAANFHVASCSEILRLIEVTSTFRQKSCCETICTSVVIIAATSEQLTTHRNVKGWCAADIESEVYKRFERRSFVRKKHRFLFLSAEGPTPSK